MRASKLSSSSSIWRVPMARIEEVVSSHLGPGRVRGNESHACFSRQVSMYLGRHVGGWSTTRIGRFYNGRHHTTVLHAVVKIERLRRSDEPLDALLDVLADALGCEAKPANPGEQRKNWKEALVEFVMERLAAENRGAASASDQANETSEGAIQIQIELPRDIAASFDPDFRCLPRMAFEALAAEGRRSGRLSEEQGAPTAGFRDRQRC